MRLTIRVVALVLAVAAIAVSSSGCPRPPKAAVGSSVVQTEAR